MAKVSCQRILHFLNLCENAQTTTERGRALEELICYVFPKIPGISIKRRNKLNVFKTEEIDVAFWNDKVPRGLSFLPNIILVECKNWLKPVSSMEVNWFDTKLKNRGLTFGILIAANGITGSPHEQTSAHNIIANALREQRQIVVLTRQEIEIITDTVQIIELFKEKLCELAVAGTAFA
ncbi:MAG: hypothetical protein A3D92_11525 [Bacteroidetes bacterium RIFCSPHIGHO2_02_FULL_44_7]|nr:MAG: hypothetical protein A3D92_11525 [Bacteroidetes bacterium RIFCSPHIGHO2_02_FULL_44_7]